MAKFYMSTTNVAGRTIITGVGSRNIDPMASSRKLQELMEPADLQFNQGVRQLNDQVMGDDPPSVDAVKATLDNLIAIHSAHRERLSSQSTVYLRGGVGKIDIGEDDAEALREHLAELPMGELLTIEGEIIDDPRPGASKDDIMASRRNDIRAMAVDMRSHLEIEGDPDALKKSQEWFQSQVKILENSMK